MPGEAAAPGRAPAPGRPARAAAAAARNAEAMRMAEQEAPRNERDQVTRPAAGGKASKGRGSLGAKKARLV